MSKIRRSLLPVTLIAAAFACGAGYATLAEAGQPKMRDALEHLEMAKQKLQNAQNDKGGHRVKAIKLVDDALAEVRQGMQFDKNN